MSSFVLTGGWFENLWINMWLMIDNVIYIFINWVYRVFMLVAKVDIFEGSDAIGAITRRLYIIVGIAMLFIFAYNLILLIVNPDGKQIGNMGKVVQNAIVSIILVTLLPLIFSYLTTIQNHIIEENVIGHLILGVPGDDEASTNKSAGVDTALTIFSAFYHPEGETLSSCKAACDAGNCTSSHEMCKTYVDAYKLADENDSITSFIWNGDLKQGAKDGDMEYNTIISTIAGGFALYMFVSFALDIGVRVGKLALYEIISPVPVMMRILPNDKMFDKWFNGIKNAYLSLFVRLIIIYFCMYAITLVPDVITNMAADYGEDGWLIASLATVVVVLGILMFAKEAPKLISDLFGGSGDGVKFGIGNKLRENKFGNAALGAAGAGFGAMAGNAWNSWKNVGKDKGWKANTKSIFGGVGSGLGGLIGGARRGAVSGYKSSTFKGLGDGITQSKIDAAVARDERNAKHQAYRHAGAIGGKERPIISSAWGGIKTNVKGAYESSIDWITGEEGSSPRAQAIAKVKGANAAIKGDTYAKGKGVTSNEQLQDWVNTIRQGGRIQFKDHWYEGGTDGSNITEAINNLSKAVKAENKEIQIKNYQDKAYVLEAHLTQLKKAVNDGKGVFGSSVEQLLASKLEKSAADCKDTALKPILSELSSGGKVQWDKIDKLLSMSKEQIAASSREQRMALAEFSDVFDGVMKQAAERNVVDSKKDK